jgi:hypothetical protein
LFPLNVNLLTSGLYATLHTLSFISVWQLQSQREFLYLSSIFHLPSFTVLPFLYVAACKLHHIFLPNTTFFALLFESVRFWHKRGKSKNHDDGPVLNLFTFQGQGTHWLYQAFDSEYVAEKDICM